MGYRRKPLGDGKAIAEELKSRRKPRTSDEYKLWEGRLNKAEEQAEQYHSVYDECKRAYEGDILGANATSQQRKDFALLRKYDIQVNKLVPVLASQRERVVPRIPWFRLNPQHAQNPTEQANMRAAEMVQNFMLRSSRMNFNRNMRLSHLGASLGYSALEVCYTPDDGKNPEKDKKQYTGEIKAEVDAQGMETFEVEGGPPLVTESGDFVRRGGKLVLDLRDPLDYFDIKLHWWETLVLDHEQGNEQEDMRFLGTRFVMRLEDALENPIFKTTDKKALRAAAKSLRGRTRKEIIRPRRPYEEMNGEAGDDFLRLEGVRFWHAAKREVVYWVDGLPDIAAKYEYPGWVGHSPIRLLRFNERLGSPYPLTEVSQALPLLRAYSIFFCTLINHLKRFKRKYGMTPTAFKDSAQRDMLLDPADGLVLQLASKNSLWPIDDAYLDPAIYKMMDRALMDFLEIMGSAPEFVGSAEADSATQAAIIDRRGVGREQERRGMMKDFLEEVSDIMLANLQHNLPRETAVRIAGPDGATWEKIVSRPDIQGKFRSWVDLQELEPQSPANEWQKQQAMIALFGRGIFASPSISKSVARSLAWHDPNIQKDLVEMGEMFLGQELLGGPAGGAKPSGNGSKPPPSGTTQGTPKPTGQGKEGNAGTEGRSRGREQRTLLGAGSSERPKEE